MCSEAAREEAESPFISVFFFCCCVNNSYTAGQDCLASELLALGGLGPRLLRTDTLHNIKLEEGKQHLKFDW